MMTHDHPAVHDAALKLIGPAGDLRDQALLMYYQPTGWRLNILVSAAAKVRADLDALDAAIAQAQVGEAA